MNLLVIVVGVQISKQIFFPIKITKYQALIIQVSDCVFRNGIKSPMGLCWLINSQKIILYAYFMEPKLIKR